MYSIIKRRKLQNETPRPGRPDDLKDIHLPFSIIRKENIHKRRCLVIRLREQNGLVRQGKKVEPEIGAVAPCFNCQRLLVIVEWVECSELEGEGCHGLRRRAGVSGSGFSGFREIPKPRNPEIVPWKRSRNAAGQESSIAMSPQCCSAGRVSSGNMTPAPERSVSSKCAARSAGAAGTRTGARAARNAAKRRWTRFRMPRFCHAALRGVKRRKRTGFLDSFDCVALPLRSASQYFRGTGNVVDCPNRARTGCRAPPPHSTKVRHP